MKKYEVELIVKDVIKVFNMEIDENEFFLDIGDFLNENELAEKFNQFLFEKGYIQEEINFFTYAYLFEQKDKGN